MAVLSSEDRKNMPESEFALPGHRFPLKDKTHDREALSGATRSYNAGNISKSQEEHVKAEAHAKLGEGKDGDPKADPKDAGRLADHRAAVEKMHPEHVHRLVQAAKDGKFGPEAQKKAHAATSQPMAPRTNPFASDDDEDDSEPANASAIFSGRNRGY